ncbi:MAG: hypothetical protein ACLFPA_02705 [Dichotomicrobium sp.]
MWDRQRRIREDSRKRALRAARDRAGRRGAEPARREAEKLAPAAESSADDGPPRASEAVPEAESEREVPESAPHDPAGSLAWTGLILLSVILGGFTLTLLFMLG